MTECGTCGMPDPPDNHFHRLCGAGRAIVNATWGSTWKEPCPNEDGLEPLVIDLDDGSKLGMLLCPEHMKDLTGQVVTWMDSIGDLRGGQN